jgi:hypothetical protein
MHALKINETKPIKNELFSLQINNQKIRIAVYKRLVINESRIEN